MICVGLLLLLCLVPLSCARAQGGDDRVPEQLIKSLVSDPDAPVIGAPGGRDVVVEFFDYRCPYCRVFQPELARWLHSDPEGRVILKEWPLFGGISIYAARVALASGWQGKYRPVHDGLLSNRGSLDHQRVREIAADAGVDLVRLDHDLKSRSGDLDDMLRRWRMEADALQLKGTPGLVIGRHVVSGALSTQDLKGLIDQARNEEALRTRLAGSRDQ